MQLVLTRMFAYFTLVSYLVVGTVVIRLINPSVSEIAFDTRYLSVFNSAQISSSSDAEIEKVELAFSDIKFPKHEAKIVEKVAVRKKLPSMQIARKDFELPFYEPVQLTKIEFNFEHLHNLTALYKGLPLEQKFLVASAEVPAEIKDEVSTKQAAEEKVNAAEPEFFDYPAEENEAKQEAAPAVETASVENTNESVAEEVSVSDLVAFDYSKEETKKNTESKKEEVVSSDVVAFDYSSATQAIQDQKIPTVSSVTTQKNSPQTKPNKPAAPSKPVEREEQNAFMAPSNSFPSQVTIQVVGTDLRNVTSLKGFEVRFQDDLSDQREDYGAGTVTIKEELASARMTRSVTILKRGFAPTNTDLIVEEGVSTASIPLIEENKFNEINDFASKYVVGAVLVELDDETEVADLDVPYFEMKKLDGDLRETSSGDYRYQLFVGVKAGNALLSYKDSSSRKVSKIIHIHENEVTYESNFFEDVTNENVALFEEDLLSRDKSPLVVSSEQVRQFASEKFSRKLDDHTYKMDFERALLGGRRYLELTHQDESVFVGIKENNVVSVPSENFMRFVLSRFENSKLGNRCLVQVNLNKKVASFEVATESTAQSLRTYTQVLDSDGKFYDSASDKTQKIIIVGENEGSQELSQDGKINIKINYQDNSTEFLSSYCSANTYLVEQL